MKKDSAVEWLYNLSKQRELDKFDWEQAKEMEKEQIVEAFDNGTYFSKWPDAEQYYNETFKSEQ
jgi:hypothetical protein